MVLEFISQHAIGSLIILAFIFFLEPNPFIGYFLPGQAILLTLGVVLSSKHILPTKYLIVISIALFLGDILGYTLGYFFSSKKTSWVKSSKWSTSIEHFFKKWGVISIILGKFFGPLRPLISFLSGFYRYPIFTFLFVSFFTGVLWVSSSLYLGYFFGSLIGKYVDITFSIIGFFVIYCVVIYGIFKGYTVLSRKNSLFFEKYKIHSIVTIALSTIMFGIFIYMRQFYSKELVNFYLNFFHNEISFSIANHYITVFLIISYFLFLSFLLFKGEKRFVLQVLFSLSFISFMSGILVLIFKKIL